MQTVVIDARGHMLGRLASILAKQMLNGQQVVRACTTAQQQHNSSYLACQSYMSRAHHLLHQRTAGCCQG